MPANKTAFSDALKKASNAAWDRRWDTAIKEYRRALAEFPADASAHVGLALALQESNKFDEALAEYTLLAKMQGDDPAPLARVALLLEKMNRRSDAGAAYLQLAQMYLDQKQMNKAVEAWRKASALEPERAEPHEKLAAAFTEAGHNGPAAREWIALAKLAQRGGDTPRATQCAERALVLEPDNTAARFLLNELAGRGTSLGAQVGASPVELARRSALSRLAASVLDDKTPWRRGDSGGRAGADMDSLLARAIDAQQHGQTREAIELYEKILGAGQARPEVQFNLAILYQNSLRHDDAIALLNQTVRTPQFAVASHFALGQSYRSQNKIDSALDHYVQAMKIVDLSSVNRSQADQVIRLYQSLSDSYHAKGDTESAQKYRATLLDFLNSKGWQDKVREVRDHIAAEAMGGTPLSMQEVFETPESQRVIELLRTSDELMREGKLYAASDLAYQAIELGPNYLPAHVQLAEVAVTAGRIPQAIEKFDALAETAEVRRDLPKAISFYKQALKLAPDDVTRRAKLINVLVQSGQLPEALAEYEAVGRGLDAAGQVQKAADKYNEGLMLAARAGVVGETVANLRRDLGISYMKLREDSKALAIFQELQKQVPDDDHVRYYLIELYFRTGQTLMGETELEGLLERYTEAPQYAQAALTSLAEAFPDEPAIARRLAQHHAETGSISKAIEILDEVGEHLLNAGRKAEAIGVIQDIIEMKPPQVNEYRRLLLELRDTSESEIAP
jgi:tetratricopeptide (TPR) repeat protein